LSQGNSYSPVLLFSDLHSTMATTISQSLAQEYASTWQWRIDTDPELAASLGMLSRRRSPHALDPRSLESFEQRLAWIDRALDRLKTIIRKYDIQDLTTDEQLSLKLYETQLTDYVTYTRQHKAYLCCVNRLEGPQTDLPLYARYLPTKTLSDRTFYRDFLKAIPIQLQDVQTLLKEGLAQQRTPPHCSLGGVVEQIRKMDIKSSFYKTFQNSVSVQEEQLQQECHQLVETDVKTAFQNFANFLEQEYIPELRTEISATKGYPNGAAYYQDCLTFHTTTSMTPQQIHDMGNKEVQRVRREMQAIAKRAGFQTNQLDHYLEYLRTSAGFEPKSNSSLLAHYRDIVGRLSPALLTLFHLETLPRQPLEITETPSASASMAPAAYYLAGSTNATTPRPGTFYVNTSELSTRRLYECEALALHEAIPGHHTQAAIQGEAPLPEYRCYMEDRRYFEAPCRFPFYTGYIEGWGLHCETLGAELGLFKSDTDKFGQLSMEAIRCCRLVVDTGMHALGWTMEEAVQFMLQNTAMSEHDARTEVTRYITWPGQACAYKVGEQFIRKMRTLAESELSDKFDPRDFYDAVLLGGAVPLNVLEDRVRAYVDKAKAIKGEGSTSEKAPSCTGTNEATDFLTTMSFANWCKCCIVPGSCQTY